MTSATGDCIGRSARGFTLIELMVVLAILSLLAASVPLAVNRLVPARRVLTAADHLMADIRALQAHCAVTGRPQQLTVRASGYELAADDGPRIVKLAQSTSVQLRAGERERPLTALTVYPDGSSSGGRVEISDSGRKAVIEISMLSGRLRRIDEARAGE